MRRRSRSRSAVAGLLLASVFACSEATTAVSPAGPPDAARPVIVGATITHLEIAPAGISVVAEGLNEDGVAAGYTYSTTAHGARGFLWSPESGMQTIQKTLGGPHTILFGINGSNQVVGYSNTATGYVHAVRWDPTTDMLRDLTPQLMNSSIAYAINDAGTAAGFAYVPIQNQGWLWRPVIWRADHTLVDLGEAPGDHGYALAISSTGAVTGEIADDLSGQYQAFLWTPRDGLRRLGLPPGMVGCRGEDINASEHIVGYCYGENKLRAFRWTPEAGMHDLGSLGGTHTIAHTINDADHVMGTSQTAGGTHHTFLWTPSDGMEDVTAVSGRTVMPTSLNNRGQYIGDSNILGTVDFEPNRPPTANAAAVTTLEDTPVSIALSATDQHHPDLTYAIASPPAHGTLTGTPPAVTYTPADGFDGTDSFTFTATDPKGLVSQPATVTITVASPNRAPVVAAGGPYAGAEGTAIALTLGATDPDVDALAFTWDLGNGTTGSGATPPTSATYPDNGTYTISLTADDGQGGTHTQTATVTVTNAAPTATFASPASVLEGSSISLALTNAQDVAADLPLEFAFDCGSGVGAWSVATIASCPTTDNGTRRIAAKVRDKDGGESAYTGTVTIQNVAPTISAALVPATTMLQRGSATLAISGIAYSDPSAADGPFKVLIDCGNGTTTGGVDATGGSCTYTAPGLVTIRITVADKDGGVSTAFQQQVQVRFDWTGFFQPTENVGVVNTVKAGSSVPIKFRLGGNYGLGILAQGSPSARTVACTTTPSDAVEEVAAEGTSGLHYDLLADQYVYVWKTDKAWAGQCRQLLVRLTDGTEHRADFKFLR